MHFECKIDGGGDFGSEVNFSLVLFPDFVGTYIAEAGSLQQFGDLLESNRAKSLNIMQSYLQFYQAVDLQMDIFAKLVRE